MTITRQFEDPKLFYTRRVPLAQSSNMEDLSDNNTIRLINEKNTNHDNNNIKNWLNHIVEEPSAVNISTQSDYKCKMVDASKLQTKRAPESLKKQSDLSINDKLI